MTHFQKLAERFVTERRIRRMETVLDQRTQWIAPVFENLNKTHNAAAVIRTGEAFGIAKVHFIESNAEYRDHTAVTQGSHRWVDVETHTTTENCFTKLRDRGYTIIGTALHEESITPAELPVDRPIALIFGNELEGLNRKTIESCDRIVRIPMYGFVESLNISVAAALLISGLMERVRGEETLDWHLTKKETVKTRQQWLYNNTRVGEIVRSSRRERRKK